MNCGQKKKRLFQENARKTEDSLWFLWWSRLRQQDNQHEGKTLSVFLSCTLLHIVDDLLKFGVEFWFYLYLQHNGALFKHTGDQQVAAMCQETH